MRTCNAHDREKSVYCPYDDDEHYNFTRESKFDQCLRSSLFWDVTQCRFVVNERFGSVDSIFKSSAAQVRGRPIRFIYAGRNS